MKKRHFGFILYYNLLAKPIAAMFIAAFVAYYILGIRRNMGMSTLLKKQKIVLALLPIFC